MTQNWGNDPLSHPPGARSDRGVRLVLVTLVLGIGFLILAGRAVFLGLQGGGGDGPPQLNVAMTPVDVRRGDLLDRHGAVLATSLASYVLVGDTDQVWDPVDTAEALHAVLPQLDVQLTSERLSREGRFVWLGRGLTPQQRDAIFALGLPGVVFETEARRVYPRGRFAAHALGFAKDDGTGAAGADFAFNARLSAGDPVRLSLDVHVQIALESELRAAMARHGASGAVGLVMDAHTGELLALASLPDYDPNGGRPEAGSVRLNRATGGVYELGSVFKALTYAIALNENIITADTLLETSPLEVSGRTLTDFQPLNGPLDTRAALAKSSNTAAARVALMTQADVYEAYLERLGLTQAPRDAGPDAAAPLLPRQWGEVERATVAYGHGLSVTPVSYAAAFASVVNGGRPVRATLLAQSDPMGASPDERVFSAETSALMRDLLGSVVSEGTGRAAAVQGYDVIGKTGTAEKPIAGGYAPDRKITSFVGAFPGSAPDFVVLAVLDEPQWGRTRDAPALAGNTAAPTVQTVITRVGPILGVLPRRADERGSALAPGGGPLEAAPSGGRENGE